jgi:hypothetical protein
MTAWLASHFFNPAFVAGGAALIAAPIIIHLINRMRYRRVRFAAMEFLLQSEQKNRRRLLLEQLLLLLLRILVVAALVLLISRLILDPSQLSIFRGAKMHHVVLLDDSGSMHDRWGETSAFQEGLKVIQEMIAEGARRPETQQFSLLLLSRPDQPLFAERDLTEAFQQETATRLDPQVLKPTHGSPDLAAGLQAVRQYLQDDKGTIRQLHVVSDFRERDWRDQRALSSTIEEMTKSGITVNLVKTVPDVHPNLAVSQLSGATQVAAAGVPLRLSIGVRNFGTVGVKDVRVVLSDDGVRVPTSILFESIDAGTEVLHDVDLRLATAGKHRLSASLEADALIDDNTRHLAVDVSPAIPVLVIDGNPAGGQAEYLTDALSADPLTTGVAPTVDTPDYLRRRPLDGFRVIYLLNVPELPADSVAHLENYVRAGGGLVWYLGDGIRPAFYNDVLYKAGAGLFPVPLGTAPRDLESDATNPGNDLVPSEHQLMAVFNTENNAFLKSVLLHRYYPVAEDWVRDDQQRADHVETIATLKNRAPLMFEHTFGKGRVFTCLTTIDEAWTNWPKDASFVVVQLEMLKFAARDERNLEMRLVGEPIQLSLDPSQYTEDVEISVPTGDGPQITRLKASPAEVEPSGDGTQSQEKPELRLAAVFRDTDAPGVYGVRLVDQNQVTEERLLAYNVPLQEGELGLATTTDLRKRLGENPNVTIHEPGQLDWVQGQDAGSEIRQMLLWALLGLLLAEQALAYRLSYHPKTAGAMA